jgi:hypothetical protein
MEKSIDLFITLKIREHEYRLSIDEATEVHRLLGKLIDVAKNPTPYQPVQVPAYPWPNMQWQFPIGPSCQISGGLRYEHGYEFPKAPLVDVSVDP